MESAESNNKENKSGLSDSSEILNRRAIFDFSVLTIITLLVLAFLYPDNSEVYLLFSMPNIRSVPTIISIAGIKYKFSSYKGIPPARS